MSDSLKKAPKVDWKDFNPTSKFKAPPPALDERGEPIVYQGIAPKDAKVGETDDGYLEFLLDPIVMKGGHIIRFTRASVKLFEKTKRDGTKVQQNANKVGTFLRSAQVNAAPQENDQYIAAVKMAGGKTIHFTIDWSAYNKDTNERVDGYMAFPEDPERPGQRKAILTKGETYNVLDRKGNIVETRTVQADVLFANARVRYFVDPTRKTGAIN